MKVALVHDWLNHKIGGAEKVLFEFANLFPEADIFTLVYNKTKFDRYLPKHKVITSYLQHYPTPIKDRPKLFIGKVKKAVDNWDFRNYDLVISSSTAWVKNIRIGGTTVHICYCHSPARMLWDSWPSYLKTQHIGPIRFGPILKFYMTSKISKLRLWDYYQTSGISHIIANSNYIAARIKKYYQRDAQIIYPPVDTKLLKPIGNIKKKPYYLILSVLSQYKNIDLAIKAFKENSEQLIIAGEGLEINKLKKLAGDAKNIEFRGRVDEKEKIALLQQATAFIFCNIEDFGITMVESLAAQTPVVALRGGGALEIIKDHKTGIFFDSPTEASLNQAITKLKKLKFQANDFSYIYDKFDKRIFYRKINRLVNDAISKTN